VEAWRGRKKLREVGHGGVNILGPDIRYAV
jgi:hypothetical protein